jgi:hypothetical protein
MKTATYFEDGVREVRVPTMQLRFVPRRGRMILQQAFNTWVESIVSTDGEKDWQVHAGTRSVVWVDVPVSEE